MSGYFPHDDDARHDPKIIAIEQIHPKGYGYFFKTVEVMYANAGELEVNKFIYSTLKNQIGAEDTKEAEKFVKDALGSDIGLFYLAKRKGKRYLRSKRVDDTIEMRAARTSQAKGAANTRWDKEQKKLLGTKKPKYKPEDDEYKLSKHFYESLLKPGGGAVPDWQKWADHFNRILRIDKRDYNFIKDTIDAVTIHKGSGDFAWGKVIKSPEKLRLRMQESKVHPGISKGRGNMTTTGAASGTNYDKGNKKRKVGT